jgi:hypothetical protein
MPLFDRKLLSDVLLPIANYLRHPTVFDHFKEHIVLFTPEVRY